MRANGALSTREREVLGLLAEGMSGAAIAERLFLSPETVRTHVRNAMSKLGASTRSQAIAIALQRGDLSEAGAGQAAEPAGSNGQTGVHHPARPRQTPAGVQASLAAGDADASLQALMIGLTSLPDVEGGAILIADEEGLSLRRAAFVRPSWTHNDGGVPGSVSLGQGPLGRVALERLPRVIHLPGPDHPGDGVSHPALAAPMLAGGRLVGAICLSTRPSRPTRATETMLLQAFSSRVAEILMSAGPSATKRLGRTLDRFRLSWAILASRG